MAPGDEAKERRLALSRRAAQPAPLPRVLAAKPVDLRVPGWIPMSTPPKSVTVSKEVIHRGPLLADRDQEHEGRHRKVGEIWRSGERLPAFATDRAECNEICDDHEEGEGRLAEHRGRDRDELREIQGVPGATKTLNQNPVPQNIWAKRAPRASSPADVAAKTGLSPGRSQRGRGRRRRRRSGRSVS